MIESTLFVNNQCPSLGRPIPRLLRSGRRQRFLRLRFRLWPIEVWPRRRPAGEDDRLADEVLNRQHAVGTELGTLRWFLPVHVSSPFQTIAAARQPRINRRSAAGAGK